MFIDVESIQPIIILLGAFLATVIGSMSGGGSGLILTPIWIMLGYPLPVAIATQQLSGVFWSPVASYQYLKKTPLDRKLILCMIIPGLIGATLGANSVVALDQHVVKKCIGALIVLLVVIFWFKNNLGVVINAPRAPRKSFIPISLVLGYYEGFFGTGNGLFTSLFLVGLRGFTLPVAIGHYYFIAAAWCALASSIFIMHGHYDLSLMIPAVIGSLLGATAGSHIGQKRGARFVRICFLSIGAVLGGSLLFS